MKPLPSDATMTAMESSGATDRSGNVRDRRFRTGPLLAIAATIALLGSRFFLIIWKYSINVFFYDQWEYMAAFFRPRASITALFFLGPAGGPIRESIGLIPDRVLYSWTRWNVRVDAF